MGIMSLWEQMGTWPIIFALLLSLLLLRDLNSIVQTVRKSAIKPASTSQPPPLRPFRFLDLPGEIRNLIYEYALTEPNGLQYIEKTRSHNGKQHRVGHLIIITSPSTDTPTGTATTPAPSQKHNIANPPRWVSQQLRHETLHLSTLYNTLTFKPAPHTENIELFASFLSKLPYPLHHRLCTITLTPDPTVTQASCSHAISSRIAASYTLSGFCLANPGVTVRWRWTSLSQKNCWVVADAVYHSLSQRRNLHFAKLVANGNTELEDFFVRVIAHMHPEFDEKKFWHETPLPTNLRIFPVEEVFDEAAFRGMLVGESRVEAFLRSFGEAEDAPLEHWVGMARYIYLNGI